MKKIGLALIAATCFVAAPAVAQQAFVAGKVSRGTLSFDGSATAGDFVGTTDSVRGAMTGGELAAVRGWVEAPITSLRTGNGRRDRDMNKSMESDKFPKMRFELLGVEPGHTRGDSLDVKLRGKFTIHGVTKEVEVPAAIVAGKDAVGLASSFPLNLKDYKIGGLSKMLGMLKMHEMIVVHVNLTFVSAE